MAPLRGSGFNVHAGIVAPEASRVRLAASIGLLSPLCDVCLLVQFRYLLSVQGKGFKCAACGEIHNDLPHVVADRPVQYWDVPEGERDSRIILTEDTCEIDNEHFFVRGVIEIPVHHYAPGFGFGVWVSHKRENYQTYLNNPDSADIGPFFGWLCTIIKFYERDTQLLKTMAHYRGNGLRPSIVLEPESDHPLALDQREGITLEKAWQIVHSYDNQ